MKKHSKSRLVLQKILKHSIFPLFGLICVGGIVCLQMPRLHNKPLSINPKESFKQEQSLKVRLDLLKQSPSFGFSNLISDWLYLDFIQYYGDTDARDITGYQLNSQYFELIVEKDPRFVKALLQLSPATTIYAGQPEASVTLLAKALKTLSPEIRRAYQVWTYKGVDELLYLGDGEAARNSYSTAANWASLHDDETSRSIGNRARQTANFLAKKPDSKKAQVSSWLMVLSNVKDENTRAKVIDRIKELGGEIIITPDRISVKLPEES